MTDYYRSNEEVASDFIIGTCRLLQKSFPDPFDHMHDVMATWDTVPTLYSIDCGSTAEFYIRPLIKCITDTDVLIAGAGELVFSGKSLELPSDKTGLSDTIDCYQIEPYQKYPGFVRLRVLGEMNFCWNCKKYGFNHTALKNAYRYHDPNVAASMPSLCTLERKVLPNSISGPAIECRQEYAPGYSLQTDFVFSVWCPQWPKEAEGWLERPRHSGWPTADTITEVAKRGCHVVYVQHRSCKDDKYQWRFSFSVAETILLQSWTPIQQIVYHLLRFFAKKELIQKNCPKEDEVLCPYHLKTLMLWSCEEMSSEWWKTSSVITICSELLQTLSEWLLTGNFSNYFIPKANLFYKPSHSDMLENTKRRLNEHRNSGILCRWFEEYYILYSMLSYIRKTTKIEEMPHYAHSMLPLLKLWKVRELQSLEFLFFSTLRFSHRKRRSVIKRRYSSGLRLTLQGGQHSIRLEMLTECTLEELPTKKNVSCFTYYDIALLILHVEYGIGCEEISWESGLFVEAVNASSTQPKNLRCWFHNFPKAHTVESSRSKFLLAQGLMQNLTGSNSRPEFQLVSLLAKEFLRKALKYDAFVYNGMAAVTMSYLAALHFVGSEYQEAMRLCLAVLEDHTSQDKNETLNSGCLLFIDDIARIVGLRVLHKKITNTKPNLHCIGNMISLDLRLSPHIFVRYVYVLCHQKSTRPFFNHQDHLQKSAFPMDEYLKTSLKLQCAASRNYKCSAVRQIVYRRKQTVDDIESTFVNYLQVKETVIDALMEYALENMATFYNAIRNDFGVQCNTIDCYRALYHYKCRKYTETLQLCDRILCESDLPSKLKEFLFVNVLLIPPIDSFFDTDVQSLLGIHTLFHYLSPLNDDLEKADTTAESTFEHCFARLVCYHECELLFLLEHNHVKFNYFLGRHFLARYLRVRCFIDCKLPYEEAITEFAAQKTILPFEQIIRRFLIRKLRFFKKQ